MALLQVLSVYDVKAESYGNPFTVPAVGMATREFQDALHNPDNVMSRHRADFDLYHLGSFNQMDGTFDGIDPPRLVMRGSDVSSKE